LNQRGTARRTDGDACTTRSPVLVAAVQARSPSQTLVSVRRSVSIVAVTWWPGSASQTSISSGPITSHQVRAAPGTSRKTTWTTREFVFRFAGPDDFVDFFRVNYGPTFTAFAGLGDDARAALYADMVELARRHDSSTNATLRIRAGYLETLAIR